jgi:hypothetical protein
MNDHDTLVAVRSGLAEVRESLADVHLDAPATELMARAEKRLRSRRRRRVSATGAACAAAVLAGTLAVSPGSGGPAGGTGRQVHVHLAGWSVDSNGNGTVLVTVHQLTHAQQLERALAQAGVPSIVTPGKNCLNLRDQNALGRSGALRSGRNGLTIHPARIPSGARILISLFYSGGGKPDGFGWSLVHSGERLRCGPAKNIRVYPAKRTR